MAITPDCPHRSPPSEKPNKTNEPVSNVVDYSGLTPHLPVVGLINPAACLVLGQRSHRGGRWLERDQRNIELTAGRKGITDADVYLRFQTQ